MSFSSDIKSEILKKINLNKKSCCIDAEAFGELLTQVSLKSELDEKYKNYLAIDPNTDYHFEISFKNKACAEYILNLLSVLDFTPKLLKRKNNNTYIVYFKESEQISMFLSIIETSKALFEFEDIRIKKDMKNNINRNINCETANLSKIIEASYKQLEAIDKIKKYGMYNSLDEKLKYTASLREKYREESLDYIASKTNGKNKITKSGLKHRLDKLIQIANELEE